MRREERETRRGFLKLAGGAGVLLSTGKVLRAADVKPRTREEGEEEEEEVSPAEDLMREHGALDRVLLIYEEAARRLDGRQDLDPSVLADSAGIVHRFIEDYHEKLEENRLFPRFEKARTLVDLVATLRAQHLAGRQLTGQIQALSKPGAFDAPAERAQLTGALRQFIRMYRPHAAREDTILFPALHRIVSPHEYDAMGEEFEDEEHRLLGEDGFEGVVSQVAEIERKLGIGDLAQFTPVL